MQGRNLQDRFWDAVIALGGILTFITLLLSACYGLYVPFWR